MKLYLDDRFLKAVTRIPPGTGIKLPAPSPTFAGTSGFGSASRGGDVVGHRGGTPVYASELKGRPGTGSASGFTGQTFKEFQKQSGGQNIPVPAPDPSGSAGDPNGSVGYPTEVGDYHHTGVSPFAGVQNHGKKIHTHDGVDHTILSHHADPNTEGGQGWYAMQSSDSGGMSRIQAKKLHDYVNHMDSLHAETVRSNHAQKEAKAQFEENQVARHGIEKTKKKEHQKKAVTKGLPSLYVALDKAIDWESGRSGKLSDWEQRHRGEGEGEDAPSKKDYGKQDPTVPRVGQHDLSERFEALETGPGKQVNKEGDKPSERELELDPGKETPKEGGKLKWEKHENHRELKTPHGTYRHWGGQRYEHVVTYTPEHSRIDARPIYLKQHREGPIEDNSYHQAREDQHVPLRSDSSVNSLVKKHNKAQPAPGELSWKKGRRYTWNSRSTSHLLQSNPTDHGIYSLYGDKDNGYRVHHVSPTTIGVHGGLDEHGHKVKFSEGSRFRTRKEAKEAALKHHLATTKHDVGSIRQLETGPGNPEWETKSGNLQANELHGHPQAYSADNQYENRKTPHGDYAITSLTHPDGKTSHRVTYTPKTGNRERLAHDGTKLPYEHPATGRTYEHHESSGVLDFRSKKAAKAAVDAHHEEKSSSLGERFSNLDLSEKGTEHQDKDFQVTNTGKGEHTGVAPHGTYEIKKLAKDDESHPEGRYRATYYPKGTHPGDSEAMARNALGTEPDDDAPRPHFLNPPTRRDRLHGKKHSIGVLPLEDREDDTQVRGHSIPHPSASEGALRGETSEVRHETLHSAKEAIHDHHKEQMKLQQDGESEPKKKNETLSLKSGMVDTSHGRYSTEKLSTGHQVVYTPKSSTDRPHLVNPPNESARSAGKHYSSRPVPVGYPRNKLDLENMPVHSTMAQAQTAVEEHHKDRMAAAKKDVPKLTPSGRETRAHLELPEAKTGQQSIKFPKPAEEIKPSERELELSLAGALEFYVDLNKGWPTMDLFKGVPTGTVHHWADGFSYRKMDDGSWQQVTAPGHPSHPDDGQGNPRDGNYPMTGEKPVENPWKARFAKYGITSGWPDPDANPSEVKVDLSGDVHSHAILTSRDLKSGKLVYAYSKEYENRQSAQKWDRILRLTTPVQNRIIKGLRTFLAGKSGTPSARKSERDSQAALICLTVVKTALRPGYEKQDTQGVGSLLVQDVVLNGNELRFDFIGKDKVRNIRAITDKELADSFRKVLKGKAPTDRVFDQSNAANADRLLGRITPDFTLKDFRTLRATEFAARELEVLSAPPPPLPGNKQAAKKLILARVDEVSARVATYLNNTQKVARTSYIHPNVINAWVDSVGGSELMKGKQGSLLDHAREMYDTVEPHTPLSEKELGNVDYYALPDWLDDEKDEDIDMNKGHVTGIFLDAAFFKAVPESVAVESARTGKRQSIGVATASTPDRPDRGRDWHGDSKEKEAEEETEASFSSPHSRVETEKANKSMGQPRTTPKFAPRARGVKKLKAARPAPGKPYKIDTPKILRKILKRGHYSLISAGRNGEDPTESSLPEDHPKFLKRHEDLRKDLQKHGIPYTEGSGNFGGGHELTFMVHHDGSAPAPGTGAFMAHHTDPSEHAVIRSLGRKYNQQAVIHSRGNVHEMHYVTGEHSGLHEKGQGHVMRPGAQDDYTAIPVNRGVSKFALTLNWGVKHPFESAIHKSFEDELRVGAREEMEHTNNPKEAEKIARDHLREDPKYYAKLRRAGLIQKSFDLYVRL